MIDKSPEHEDPQPIDGADPDSIADDESSAAIADSPESEGADEVESDVDDEPAVAESESEDADDAEPDSDDAAEAEDEIADAEEPHAEADSDTGNDEEDEDAEEVDEAKSSKSKRAVQPIEVDESEDEPIKMDWYILKVQSNREKSICDGLKRRVAVAGLDEYFSEILVPTEDVAEFKNGKRRVVKRKLYPGYIVVHMEINDDTWFLVRETPGIGDFTGAAGKPTPMLPHEVDRIVKSANPEEEDEPIKTAIPFKDGDRVRIKEGTFENFEGDVEGIDEANGRVTVMINIFGRSTPVELEHWQIEAV